MNHSELYNVELFKDKYWLQSDPYSSRVVSNLISLDTIEQWFVNNE